ncbi:putative nucleic acid-binding Zn-ribbon protein [Rhodococcus sp. SORGH_AS303]|nr:putative nucleic acid-binding Zn-ribbon protein [Rhodococcus sp. SORGH_AS_0301]MDQ1201112.1 putative nucleic acid-binding Zn-ribbon protein [Rhodococcus sp. SORGH_AS_0303]
MTRVNVDPKIQLSLLDLAAMDTELAQLAHRRRTLPEQVELDALERERIDRKDAAVGVQISLDDLDRDIRKLEGEVDAVRRREEKDRAALASGAAPAKQLSELQHELGSLERRRGILEDELLEVMEQREASQSDYEHAGANLTQVEDTIVDATRRRDDALADVENAERTRSAQREELAAQLPAEVSAMYEKQRERSGIGAALLRGRRCGACRIELDRGEIARIAGTAPDVVVRCSECNAILVRTNESGL